MAAAPTNSISDLAEASRATAQPIGRQPYWSVRILPAIYRFPFTSLNLRSGPYTSRLMSRPRHNGARFARGFVRPVWPAALPALIAVLAAVALAGCGGGPAASPPPGAPPTQ